MTHDPSNLDISTIRELLKRAFTPEELRSFCMDRPKFQPVVDKFGPGHGLDDMVDEVIDYCRTRSLFNDLLTAVKEARPRPYARYFGEPQAPPEPARPLSERQKGPPYRSLVSWFLVGAVPTMMLAVFFWQPLRCVLEYRITEANVALLGILAGGVGVILTRLLPPDLRRALLSTCAGAALVLIVSLLGSVLSQPIPPEECPGIIDTVTPSSTPTPSPSQTPMSPPTTAIPTHTPTSTPPKTPEPPTDTFTPTPATPTVKPSSTPTYSATPTIIPTPLSPPAPSPTSSAYFIVYTDCPSPNLQDCSVWGIRADDSDSARKIVDHASEPALSRDGDRFAFYRRDGGLYVWDFGTQSHRQIVLSGRASFATWAPSGERLAYYVEQGVRWIYSVDVNSRDDYMPLTPGMRPSWSPKDDFIAYDSCDGTRCGLFRISPEGTDLRQLTSDGGASVAVSPDGQQIAYRVSVAGTYDIFVIRADGTNPQPIIQGASNDVQPTWSPDGRYIYYLSDRGGRGWAVMEMTANGDYKRTVVELGGCPDLWQHQRISVTRYDEAIHGRE